MRYFCTSFGCSGISRGLALHQSLTAHAGGFELVVLCLDDTTQTTLAKLKPAGVRLLGLTDLISGQPALAAARADRTDEEFYLTCKSWLIRHLLAQIPSVELLTYLDADLYLFNSPQPLFEEIGAASVAIVPCRYPATLSHLERRGKFDTSWISFRHDSAGQACAADWSAKCAAWCFTRVEPGRYADQKYLDVWSAQFPGTVSLAHPGAGVAPWNVAGRTIATARPGPTINQVPLITYHFRGLTHLHQQLFDPGLHAYDATPSSELREQVYRPYLRQLSRHEASAKDEPDIVPPARADDPRCGAAVSALLLRLRSAERERAAALAALGKNRAAADYLAGEFHLERAQAARYIKEIEQERDAQRKSLLEHKHKLKGAYTDLERNIIYLKRLQDEVAAHIEVSIVRDTHIANLHTRLAGLADPAAPTESGDPQAVLRAYLRQLRRVLVAKYHPALQPVILAMSAMGIAVDVLGSPAELTRTPQGSAQFRTETIWEWLGRINSLFNEQLYLLANPDVAAAISQGQMHGAWEHYLMFGQQEGRKPGTSDYCTGLGEVDAIVFDSADRERLVPCLIGRMQPQAKLIISSYFGSATGWLPPDNARTLVLQDVLLCHRPPQSWIGPRLPANSLAIGGPRPEPQDIYPPLPAQHAEWPRISVVITSRNRGAYLEETLRSALDQKYPNLECIVLGAGTTDDSAAILSNYSDRLALPGGGKAGGPPATLDQAMRGATGRILTWLDAGDRLAPAALFTVGQMFLLHGMDVAVGRSAQVVDRQLLPRQLQRPDLPTDHIAPLPLDGLLDLEHGWLPGTFFRQPGVFFTREIFDRAGGQVRDDLPFGAEYDLWLRMARAGARVFALPEILSIAREIEATGNANNDQARLAELSRVNAAHQKA